MHAFIKDWRRWSRAERIAAVMILSTSLICFSAVLALNVL